jgi:hypothetical protein
VSDTQERLWLGTYTAPEAAAVVHDAATCLLRGPTVAGAELGKLPDAQASSKNAISFIGQCLAQCRTMHCSATGLCLVISVDHCYFDSGERECG